MTFPRQATLSRIASVLRERAAIDDPHGVFETAADWFEGGCAGSVNEALALNDDLERRDACLADLVLRVSEKTPDYVEAGRVLERYWNEKWRRHRSLPEGPSDSLDLLCWQIFRAKARLVRARHIRGIVKPRLMEK
jgi:hypothetical protein